MGYLFHQESNSEVAFCFCILEAQRSTTLALTFPRRAAWANAVGLEDSRRATVSVVQSVRKTGKDSSRQNGKRQFKAKREKTVQGKTGKDSSNIQISRLVLKA